MSNNTTTQKSFVDTFNGLAKNLAVRYTINMHLDFINEFVKFSDNTRDLELLNAVLDQIQLAESSILNIIKCYEDESKN